MIILDDDGKVTGITTKTDITNAYSRMYPGKFKVKDYMTKKVTTCRKSDSLQFALNMINKNGISRLVVTDQYGIPAGIITRNTFLKHTNNFKKSSHKALDYWTPTKLSKTLPVEKILNHDILLVDLEDDLAEAARLMVKNLVSGIPVIDKEKNLVGIITKSDVVRAFTQVESNAHLLEKYKQTY
jgi:predicted transcriptional regulator